MMSVRCATGMWALCLCLTALVAGVFAEDARAKMPKNTVAVLTTKYQPTNDNFPSNYVRVLIDKLDKDTVSSATIGIKRGKDTFNYTVPAEDIASSQPKLGQNEAKPGRIDFRLPTMPDPMGPALPPLPVQTYKQGDVVTLTINYNKDFSNDVAKGKYQAKSAVFRSGVLSARGNADESKPIPVNGFKYTLDPEYSSFNDLDTSVYGSSGSLFEVRNLRFFSNVDEAFMLGFDAGALLGESYDTGLPHFLLGSSDNYPCPPAVGGSFASCESLLNSFLEPDPGMYVMAVGQIFDTQDGTVVATFLNAAQADLVAPEPPVVALVLTGCLWIAVRRRAAGAAPSASGR